MSAPLFYILAPFGLAFGLFTLYLVVSLFMGDPARPFRMFSASAGMDPASEGERILSVLDSGELPPRQRRLLTSRLEAILASGEGDEDMEHLRTRYEQWLNRNRHDRAG